ncbi:unnamed protein product [Timema podura]|uniref:Uncharacterized protein n=1 Tax=Timema podura TaxID=61482 RepID=A0ABN7NUC8_TIMPD|nr:unnamed protein product [Timema podura]
MRDRPSADPCHVATKAAIKIDLTHRQTALQRLFFRVRGVMRRRHPSTFQTDGIAKTIFKGSGGHETSTSINISDSPVQREDRKITVHPDKIRTVTTASLVIQYKTRLSSYIISCDHR